MSALVLLSRAFLKHSVEVVYMLEGKRASVILQGDAQILTFTVRLPVTLRYKLNLFIVTMHFLVW